MNKLKTKSVNVRCYNCGGKFDMSLKIFIKESSLECPECLGGLGKDKDKFCKELVSKDWLRAHEKLNYESV